MELETLWTIFEKIKMILIVYVYLCANKLKCLDKMDKYLEIYSQLRLNHKEMETEECIDLVCIFRFLEWGHKSLSLTSKFEL